MCPEPARRGRRRWGRLLRCGFFPSWWRCRGLAGLSRGFCWYGTCGERRESAHLGRSFFPRRFFFFPSAVARRRRILFHLAPPGSPSPSSQTIRRGTRSSSRSDAGREPREAPRNRRFEPVDPESSPGSPTGSAWVEKARGASHPKPEPHWVAAESRQSPGRPRTRINPPRTAGPGPSAGQGFGRGALAEPVRIRRDLGAGAVPLKSLLIFLRINERVSQGSETAARGSLCSWQPRRAAAGVSWSGELGIGDFGAAACRRQRQRRRSAEGQAALASRAERRGGVSALPVSSAAASPLRRMARGT